MPLIETYNAMLSGYFKIPPELVFVPDDLLLFDQGPSVMQHERQRRVMTCVLEVGFVASHSKSCRSRQLVSRSASPPCS